MYVCMHVYVMYECVYALFLLTILCRLEMQREQNEEKRLEIERLEQLQRVMELKLRLTESSGKI